MIQQQQDKRARTALTVTLTIQAWPGKAISIGTRNGPD